MRTYSSFQNPKHANLSLVAHRSNYMQERASFLLYYSSHQAMLISKVIGPRHTSTLQVLTDTKTCRHDRDREESEHVLNSSSSSLKTRFYTKGLLELSIPTSIFHLV